METFRGVFLFPRTQGRFGLKNHLARKKAKNTQNRVLKGKHVEPKKGASIMDDWILWGPEILVSWIWKPRISCLCVVTQEDWLHWFLMSEPTQPLNHRKQRNVWKKERVVVNRHTDDTRWFSINFSTIDCDLVLFIIIFLDQNMT